MTQLTPQLANPKEEYILWSLKNENLWAIKQTSCHN